MIDFQKIGKYQVTAKLGQGSFGVVYRGRDAYLKRDVAIKVCSVKDVGLRKRFLREAEIAGKLVHKNIVTVYEFGFEGEIPFLVQELLPGEDLNRIIKRRARLAVADKIDILLQVAGGLGYAHTEGVIHRDIKPGNVRVLGDGGVKIMDFGIAKLASAETQLTQKGVTMGTASYLPPEQIRGSNVDHRADIFSFGVLAHELLTFERPFQGGTLSALVYQILYKVPQPMTSTWDECPEALSDLVGRCLEKKPDRRFGSFGELIPGLAEFRNEVVAGGSPALSAVAVAQSTAAAEARDPSDVLDPGEITRTAKGLLEGRVGEYTISTVVPAREVLRPPESEPGGRSTRPMKAVAPPAEEPPAEEPPTEEPPTEEPPAEEPTAEEPPAEEPTAEEPPTEEPPTEEPTAEEPPTEEPTAATLSPQATADETLTEATAGVERPPRPAVSESLETRVMSALPIDASDLASAAHEISELVAQGRLEAAKEQLEATISRKDLTGIEVAPEESAARLAEDRSPGTEDSLRDTREFLIGQETAGGGAVPAPSPPEPARPSDAIRSDTYRTFLGPPLGRLKWLGLAAVVVLVAGLGWLMLRHDGESAPEPVVETPPPTPVAPAPAPEPELGALAVNALPWAEITEITDARGFVKDLPEAARTPFYLELPPGLYTVHLRHPDSEEIQTCDVEVTPDAVAGCTQTFAELRADEYFKENGWWQ